MKRTLRNMACSRSSNRRSDGFTIVELLIVIVVIGILAAITIVAFTGVQEKARQSQFYSDIAGIKKAMEMFKAQNGNYPQCPTGSECMYATIIKPQLEPEYTSGLSTYNFNYVVQMSGANERWAMRYYANAAPYQQPQTCKFGVNMASTWYSSAPEC